MWGKSTRLASDDRMKDLMIKDADHDNALAFDRLKVRNL
jgi:hypothetical protein